MRKDFYKFRSLSLGFGRSVEEKDGEEVLQ